MPERYVVSRIGRVRGEVSAPLVEGPIDRFRQPALPPTAPRMPVFTARGPPQMTHRTVDGLSKSTEAIWATCGSLNCITARCSGCCW